jgi:predicted  nucleic acid-binding Zn-ribbon protein
MYKTILPTPVEVGTFSFNTLEGLVDIARYYHDLNALNTEKKENINQLWSLIRKERKEHTDLQLVVRDLENKLVKLTNRLHKKEFLLRQRSERIEELVNILSVKGPESNYIPSNALENVQNFLYQREKVGYNKYGTTVDREDYTAADWLLHLKEELADGLMYIAALEQKAKEEQPEIINTKPSNIVYSETAEKVIAELYKTMDHMMMFGTQK